ncbi:MAG: NAD(P)-binding domain-containing protein [Candidatus Gracilibacteria bacterium]|jgi:glycerol-3-phosphate dehydrogenase (NAD(P)+)|nr:NAD(P)-binding domain-containing protein [Candidatus Gracilibacteria bacterium]
MKIAIIGAGEIGQAVRYLISKKDEIRMWDKDPSKVAGEMGSLKDAVSNMDAVFVCIPSNFVRELIMEIKEIVSSDTLIIGISKGMESATNMTNIETFKDLMPSHEMFAIVSGPMLAEEIVEGKICAAVLASENEKALEVISEIFNDTNLKFSMSKKPLEIATLGILKNIYAILCGVSDGLEFGNNTKSYLITRSISEMRKIMKELFGDDEEVFSYAGLGDFLTTSSGLFSKNYSFGYEMAKFGKSEIMSEGRISIPFFAEKLGENTKNLPLFLASQKIVSGTVVKEAFAEIL